jgi:hypothetical protein
MCKDRHPALSPLRARKTFSPRPKNEKPTPIDDGLHATPSNDCDQDHQFPIIGIKSLVHLTHHSLPISFLFSASSFTSLTLTLVRFLPPICCPDSGLTVLVPTPGTISLFRERSAPPRCIAHTFYTLSNLCVCGCIIGTSAPPSRLFTASDYYSLKISKPASFFCDA